MSPFELRSWWLQPKLTFCCLLLVRTENELTIKLKPQLETCHPSTVQCKSGEKLKLEFFVLGKPRPYIAFFKECQFIESSSRVQFCYNEDNSISIVFHELLPFDSGVYSIVAKNGAGSTKVFFTLQVEGMCLER